MYLYIYWTSACTHYMGEIFVYIIITTRSRSSYIVHNPCNLASFFDYRYHRNAPGMIQTSLSAPHPPQCHSGEGGGPAKSINLAVIPDDGHPRFHRRWRIEGSSYFWCRASYTRSRQICARFVVAYTVAV